MRCFIALELPGEIKARLGTQTRELSPLTDSVKWVPQKNLHLTLKFLGDVAEDKIPSIKQALTLAVGRHNKFNVSVQDTKVFPNARRPRVIWAGLKAADELEHLHRDIESALIPLGFAPEGRPFRPHLTIGRVKRGGKNLKELVYALDEHTDTSFGDFTAVDVTVFHSNLTPSGAIYAPVFTTALV